MDKNFRELCSAMILLTAALVMAFSPDAYVPMLARAFLVPAVVVFAGIAVVSAWRRKWWVVQSAVVGCAIMALQVHMPFTKANGEVGPGLRVFHMNVLQPNTAFDAAINEALRSNADVISVQEVGPEWACALREGLQAEYPYTHVEERTNCYGIALFSKLPFNSVRTIVLRGAPFIEAFVTVQCRSVRLLAVHATSPISYGHFRRRNEQLGMLGEYLANDDTATVLFGDLNTVPWDGSYRRFCARSGLLSTTPLLQRTWPSVGPLAVIPLDHVLISPSISTAGLRTVNVPGSDHRGLIADLHFAAHAQ